jgi:hypothetical protein
MPATDAEFCRGCDAVCTSTVASSLTDPHTCNASANDFIDLIAFNPEPASVYDAPTTNAVPVAPGQHQHHVPPPPATNPVEDHADVIIDAIDSIDSEDFDFAMDCYDVYPDDLVQGLL